MGFDVYWKNKKNLLRGAMQLISYVYTYLTKNFDF